MTFLIIAALVVATIIVIRVMRNSAGRNAYAERSAQQPLDPALVEVFHRTESESDWRARGAADDALRQATPHVRRMSYECGEPPVLIIHQTTSNTYLAKGGLLVVTTDKTLLFAEGKMLSLSHRGGTTTAISGVATQVWIDIHGGDGSFSYACDSLEVARLVCGAIDTWADNLEVRYVPGAHVTPHRVQIPVEFFANVLRASRYPVTPSNLRALQERFGMLFVHYSRKLIDSTLGLAVGEQFTRDHGRPADDRDLPQWPERVLHALIGLCPDAGHTMAPFLPGRVHDILLENYLARPERPLSMWMSDEYENDGTGIRRHGPRGALPPMPA